MINGKTYYEILDLPKYGINDQNQRVSQESIERNYRRLAFGVNGQDRANFWLMGGINEAYRVLSDYEARRQYDAFLTEQRENNAAMTSDEVSISPEAEEAKMEEPVAPVTPEAPTEAEEKKQEPVAQATPETPTEAEEKKQEPVAQATPEAPTEAEGKKQEPVAPVIPEDVGEEKVDESEPRVEDEANILDEKTLIEEANIKASNKKRIINNVLIIGGSTLFFGPIGAVASIILLKKKGKFKLQKTSRKARIKDIKTMESKIIEGYNQKLEREIDELLNSPLKDNQSRYKLEIAKLRYKNQIDLLEERIRFKKTQKSELGGKAYNGLYVLSLEMSYDSAIKRLEVRKKKAELKLNVLNSYVINTDKTDRLTDIQNKINDTRRELSDSKISKFGRNNKLAKLNRLNSKKIQKINKMALKKNGISRGQVALAAFNSIASKFKVDEKVEEQVQDGVKTR